MKFQSSHISLFLVLFLALSCSRLASCSQREHAADVDSPDFARKMASVGAEGSSKLYIVHMGEKKHEDVEVATASHYEVLTSVIGSKEDAQSSLVYSYRHGFSGFAAMLTDTQAKKISENGKVMSVKPSRTYRLHTTRSWDFLGLNSTEPSGILQKANYGEGLIIGVIDTGIWPESESFNDKGYGPIPSKWKGKCQVGQPFGATNCSQKIIGSRWYSAGASAENLKGEFLSARDRNGHGTHTASTAAGNIVENVSFNGLAAGTARGGAPRARLAIYKACWGAGDCDSADVLKAMDDAIHDGVDILSLSIGGDGYPSASLQAVKKGITVIFSASNDGPAPQTVEDALPWVLTVAASTMDRSFPTVITLGNDQKLVGQSLFYNVKNNTNFTELVPGGSCDTDALNGTDVRGKVVVCYPASYATVPGSDLPNVVANVLLAGGGGLIYAQYTVNILEILLACEGIPCVVVDYEIGTKIIDYLDATRTPVVKVTPAVNVLGEEVLAPKVAAFSSRGPSAQFPQLIKPDVAAPGVSILAAQFGGYVLDSGTSMACPHVSGVVALLKSLHPDWSPAAIKSSIVTTASQRDGYGVPIMAESTPRKLADPFDFGGGHINPNKASDPGLIYDIDPQDYLKFFSCSFGPDGNCNETANPLYYLNLPSIAIPNLRSELSIWRTVSNVGKEVDATYKATVKSPHGVNMVVEPSTLQFNATQTIKTFKVTFMPKRKVQGDYTFGSLTWKDGMKYSVRIPIAVRIVIQDSYADTS